MKSNMLTPRRKFLGWLGSVAGLAVSWRSAEAAGDKKKRRKRSRRRKRGKLKRSPDLHEVTEAHFEEFVGDKFEISDLRRHIKVDLVEVREHDHHSDEVQRPKHVRAESFSLLLKPPKGGERLGSGIFELEHPEFGDISVFLHEVREDKQVHYEVVFN